MPYGKSRYQINLLIVCISMVILCVFSNIVAAADNDLDVVGVAPGMRLTGVKVLGCNGSGSTSGVIKGVDWVTARSRVCPKMPSSSSMTSATRPRSR